MTAEARYGVALVVLFATYLLQSYSGRAVETLVDIMFIGLFLLVLFDRDSPRWAYVLGGLLVAVSAALTLTFGATKDPTLGTYSLALNAAVLALTVVLVIRRLLKKDDVRLTTVFGAILAYALIGYTFAAIYGAIALGTGQPIFTQGDVWQGDYAYFSFVVLTTLGFGDLTPATDLVKRLVVLESVGGQVFMVVLVARLVSLWRSPGSGRSTDPGPASHEPA